MNFLNRPFHYPKLFLLVICVLGVRHDALAEDLFIYDDIGRLKQVMDQTGAVATYNYDAVGNILSIERGDGGCPVDAPSVARVVSDTCFAGASCQIRVDGASLLGAGVVSADSGIAVTDCRSECGQVSCTVSASPLLVPGPVQVTLVTSLGSVGSSVEIFPPPILENVGSTGVWHFAANAGAVITLSMNRIANRADGSSTLDPFVTIRDSRGFEIGADDDSGLNIPFGPGRNAVIRDLTLPATDTYTVVARGSAGTSGPYVLDMMPPTISLIPGQVTAVGPDARVLVFSGEIAGPERDTLAFAANAGERATIEARRITNNADGTGSLDPAIELRDSRDFLIAGDSDTGTNNPPGPGRNAVVPNFPIPATDTYRLTVIGEAGSVGPYEVRITLRSPDRASLAASTDGAVPQTEH